MILADVIENASKTGRTDVFGNMFLENRFFWKTDVFGKHVFGCFWKTDVFGTDVFLQNKLVSLFCKQMQSDFLLKQ
jgi:hypothetical protein